MSRSARKAWELAVLLAFGLPEPPLPWQPSWMPRFLDVLSATGNASEAIRNVPLSRKMIYEYRNRCDPFREAWAAALAMHAEENE